MYDQLTGSYTLKDPSGSYDWIVEEVTRADVRRKSDTEIYVWIDELISSAKEADWERAVDASGYIDYPLRHWISDEVIKDHDAYLAAVQKSMQKDYSDERDYVFRWLKKWADEDSASTS